MKYYDCFMYFDEDMVLDLRLNILDKYVSKFIICEATYNHKGVQKKLNFNIENFKKFKDKIIYLVLDKNSPEIIPLNHDDTLEARNKKILHNSINRDVFQRNHLMTEILKLNDDDLILISDLDEIPNLQNFKYKSKINVFVQDMFSYKFNLKLPNRKWIGSRACKKKHLISPQWLRNIKNKSYPFWRIDTFFSKKKYMNLNYIENGGWHFTSIKTAKELYHKLSNFAHHLEFEESGLKLNDIEDYINKRKNFYNYSVDKKEKKYSGEENLVLENNNKLPKYLTDNISKYKDWLA